MGKIYFIIGKSASGKDTIYRKLLEKTGAGSARKEAGAESNADTRTLHPVVTYTTRPMREGEVDGREYHFVDVETLERFRAENRLIEERTYQTVYGPWVYFTADDGAIRLAEQDYLCIGTLESLAKMQEYYGTDAICPIYIEVDDGERLQRALTRERAEDAPRYEEMCRRFLADQADFSEENLKKSGIQYRVENLDVDRTVEEILDFIDQSM